MQNIIEFARRLKEQRDNMGWTQAQLAEKIGVTPQTISAYEKNMSGDKGKTPTLDKVIDIAKCLGTSIDYLCGLSNESSTKKMNNLADVLDYVNELARHIHCSAGTKYIQLPEAEWYPVTDEFANEFEVRDQAAVVIVLNSYLLANFFKKRDKMRRLANEGTIDRELYDSWYSGEVERLRKEAILPPSDIGQELYSLGDILEDLPPFADKKV